MNPTIISIDLSGVNCYLLKQEENFILCDTGGHLIFDKPFNNRRDELLQALKTHGCTKDNLKLILLTHGDNDHVANAAYISQTFDAPIAMHEADLFLVQNPNLTQLLASFHYDSLVLNMIGKLMMRSLRKIMQHTLDAFDNFTPSILLKDKDTLADYGMNAQIIHLPGHTPGSIGILTSTNELICGDLFQNNKKSGKAPNAMNFNLLQESIKKLHPLDITTVYPGHGARFHFSSLKL